MARFTAENIELAEEIIARYPRAEVGADPAAAPGPGAGRLRRRRRHGAHRRAASASPPAEVLGTCSFYEMFKREPVGELPRQRLHQHLLHARSAARSCCTTPRSTLGIKAGSTTADGMFTLEDVECIAACTEAPCLQVNYRYFHKVTHDDARRAARRPAGRPPRRTRCPTHGTLARIRQQHPRRPPGRQRRPRRARASRCGCARTTPRPTARRRRDASPTPPPDRHRPASDLDDGHTLDGYLATGGYEGLRGRAGQDAAAQVGDEVKAASLLGRGGAGFPAGTKWGFCPPGVWPRYLVVNGDESEPGTYKDRLLMERDPHQLIEGVLIACYAIGCRAGLPLRPGRDGPGPGAHRRRPSTRPTPPATSASNILGSDFSRRHRPALGRRRLHRRRGDGAHRVARGQPGHAPAQAAVLPGRQGPLPAAHRRQQRRDAGQPAVDRAQRRRRVRRARRRDVARARALFAVSGHVKQPGRVRGRVRRHHLPRPHLRRRVYGGGIRDGNAAQGVHPRRRLGARGSSRSTSTCRSRPARSARPARCSARAPSSSWTTPPTRCKACLAGRAVLRPRVVRQVHARAARARAGSRRSCAASSTATAGPSDLDLLLDVVRQHQPRHHLAAAADHDLPARPVGRVADRVGDRPLPGRVRGLLRRHRPRSPSPINGKAYVARAADVRARPPVSDTAGARRRPSSSPSTASRSRPRPGELVIDAAERNGIYIPRFCYHPRMEPVGMCRMCLVEIDTGRGPALQPACMIPVAPRA